MARFMAYTWAPGALPLLLDSTVGKPVVRGLNKVSHDGHGCGSDKFRGAAHFRALRLLMTGLVLGYRYFGGAVIVSAVLVYRTTLMYLPLILVVSPDLYLQRTDRQSLDSSVDEDNQVECESDLEVQPVRWM